MNFELDKLYAIKDCMDLKITPLGAEEEEPYLVIDYLNKTTVNISSETVYAKKKGNNFISFGTSKTGELILESESTNFKSLGLMLGAEQVTEEGIKITGNIPNTHYLISGTFRYVYEDGNTEIAETVFYKAKPKAECEIVLDSENVAQFSLKFDLLVDGENRFIDMGKPPVILPTE